jgi:hypothetical protein
MLKVKDKFRVTVAGKKFMKVYKIYTEILGNTTKNYEKIWINITEI